MSSGGVTAMPSGPASRPPGGATLSWATRTTPTTSPPWPRSSSSCAGYDLVMGNRFRGGIRPGAMPWLHRYVGNPVLTGILNLFFHSPIGDAHCGLRGFRKDSCATEPGRPGDGIRQRDGGQGHLSHQKIAEVPIVLHPDGRDRPPHLRSFHDGWRHLRFMLLCTPTFLFILPGLVLTLLGLAATPP